ncbi:unnamed protein product [Miscanthus lutarioriparius]|uniref:BHLH domain-containing protein n=1 Tax=Miscanthus lutarioriparius TaxID=422564 RepID=A0A811PED0_9POAL|nr:unnamed protein product [Miscanthus lutarioriparius]
MAVERKEVERRQQMKSLCVKLASLIPKNLYSSEDAMTQLGSLDEAATYIKKLKERVEELRQKRTSARLLAAAGIDEAEEVRQHSDVSSLDVVLISSLERPFKLHEVATVLQEEGAETTNANFSVAGT